LLRRPASGCSPAGTGELPAAAVQVGDAAGLETLRGVIEAGNLKTGFDRRFPLVQTVAAQRCGETGRKRGNVVVNVINPGPEEDLTGAAMKAIVYHQYGSPDVLKVVEVEKPTPGEREVLVRIHASSINSRDWRLMRANPFFVRFMQGGVLRPARQNLGADLAGRVEAVGTHVRDFSPGDAVYGCLTQADRSAYAEYVCAAEGELAPKPANLTFGQAAAAPLAALTALQGLRDKGSLQAGQKVLIQGASGGVGAYAIQIARAFGAEVTAVCSTRNLEQARSLGAAQVIDYTKADFTRAEQRYDLILAANGYHPLGDYLRALTPQGTYVVVGGSMWQLFPAMLRARRNTPGGQKVFAGSMEVNKANLFLLKELLESGKVVSVIDRSFPLEHTAEAFRFYEQQHARGKLVITMPSAGG
jgi:NADPH:quinone reductase-like Zn-dependent oxidoreductase